MPYLITFYLRTSDGRTWPQLISAREAIEDEIVEFGYWWHYMRDVWMVDTTMTVDEMHGVLSKYLRETDDLLIIGIQPPYQGQLLDGAWKWLNKRTGKRKDAVKA